MPPIFNGGKLLFRDGKIALSENCCCENEGGCEGCSSVPSAPYAYVTLAGITQGLAAYPYNCICPDFDGVTFSVGPIGNSPFVDSPCTWANSFEPENCGPPEVQGIIVILVKFVVIAGDVYLKVVVTWLNGTTTWLSDSLGTSPIDCSAITSVSLPHVTNLHDPDQGCLGSDGTPITVDFV